MESGNAREPEGDEFAAELRMGEWEEREYWLDKERPQEEKDIALLKAGADPGSKNDEGWAPLILAAMGGHGEVARRLLEAGASLEDRGSDGLSAEEAAKRATRRNVEGMLKAERVAREEAAALEEAARREAGALEAAAAIRRAASRRGGGGV